LRLLQSTTGFRAVDLSDFLQADVLGWDTHILFDALIQGLPAGGELITDEVVLAKENTSKMDTDLVYSSCNKRVLQGQAYAVLLWANETMSRVVGFRAVQGDLFAVTEDLLRHFLALGPLVTGLRADGMYFKPDCWKRLKALGLSLVSKPRRDSKWWLGNEPIQLKIWAAQLDKASFHYYGKQKVYARSFLVTHHDRPPCKLVVIRPQRSCPDEDIQFVLTTDLSLTTRQIFTAYRKRWRIEVTFRDCKQHLGLADHQGWKHSSLRHVAMVFLTFNFLAHEREQLGGTIGKRKKEWIQLANLERTTLLDTNQTKYNATQQLYLSR
jgi:Transposase DDE domain